MSRRSRPGQSPASPARSPAQRIGKPRMVNGIVQQRLQQLQEVHGAHHHELREVRGDQGDHLRHLQADHHLQAGMHHVHHGRREENKTENDDKINVGEAREERGPPCTYLDSRRDRSSSSSPSSRPPQGATTSPRTKEDKCKGQGEEDIKKKEEKKLKEIEEELSGRKKMSIQNIHPNIFTNNCTCRTSRGHAYLGDGGVLAGLAGPAGVSLTSSSPPGTIVTAPEEKIPPFHRIGVPPVAVTNGGLYATRHQLHNCSILKQKQPGD